MAYSQTYYKRRRIRVSDFCWTVVCSKRAKLQSNRPYGYRKSSEAMKKGTELHKVFNMPYRSFDNRLIKYKIWDEYGRIFTRDINGVTFAGSFDNLNVLPHYRGKEMYKKTVCLLEYKTTSRRFITIDDINRSVFQLQLYMYILSPIIELIGWKIHPHGWVEFYSQKDRRLMKRVIAPMLEESYLEEYTHDIMEVWNGLKGMKYPIRKHTCRVCPRYIKEKCSYYIRYNVKRRL